MALDSRRVAGALFYCPDLVGTARTANLDSDESRHVRGSRRLAVGESIWLFDGNATFGRAIINAVNRERRVLEVKVQERHGLPAPRPQAELACARPKGEHQRVLLMPICEASPSLSWGQPRRAVCREKMGA